MPFAAKRAGELVQFRPDGAWGITRISGRLEWSRGGRFAPVIGFERALFGVNLGGNASSLVPCG